MFREIGLSTHIHVFVTLLMFAEAYMKSLPICPIYVVLRKIPENFNIPLKLDVSLTEPTHMT